MLLLPMQGVDIVMAYEELSRPDTTLNVFWTCLNERKEKVHKKFQSLDNVQLHKVWDTDN